MKIITIDKNNIETEHICCAIGNDKKNAERSKSKKLWMRNAFDDGLVFKRLDARGKVFIEYMPVEKVWKPITGHNFMTINCLWVSGQYKGKGLSTMLVDDCIRDAKSQKMDGVVVVSSSKVMPFLTDKKFFIKNGFSVSDTADPYFELLSLKFNNKAVDPKFTDFAIKGTCTNNKGFTFIYSNQCPFMEEYVELLSIISSKMNIPSKIIKISNYQDAQKFGSPFGTLGIYYNGKFKTHELMPEKKFVKFIENLL